MNDAAASGRELGQMIAMGLGPLLAVALGFFVSRTLTRRRADGKKVQWPLIAGVILALLMILGQLQGR